MAALLPTPARTLAAAMTLLMVASACSPGVTEHLPDPVAGPSSSASGSQPDCPPKAVDLVFKLGNSVPSLDREIIRQALTQARDYFPLRFNRHAGYSYARDRWECFPARYTEPVENRTELPASGAVAQYAHGAGIRFFVTSPGWQDYSIADRYAVAFHEAYHWAQDLRLKSEDGWRTRVDPLWLIEGTAEWFGYEAAAHFGHVPSLDAALADQAARVVHGRGELSTFEGYEHGVFSAYPLYFLAVDHLIRNHGGRKAIRAYWNDHRPYSWKEIFRRNFDISITNFYKEFART